MIVCSAHGIEVKVSFFLSDVNVLSMSIKFQACAFEHVPSCGITNALNGTEDEVAWEEEGEEAEDPEDAIDDNFETKKRMRG